MSDGAVFPNESEAYRSARDERLGTEADLRAHVARVAAPRRKLTTAGKGPRLRSLLFIPLTVFATAAACSTSTEEHRVSAGGAGAPGVLCADGAVCAPGDSCCVLIVAGEPSICEATCQKGTPYSCDGPEDCGGNACCGDQSSGVACVTTPDCAAGVPRHCHANVDCPSGERCLIVTIAGVPADNCIKN